MLARFGVCLIWAGCLLAVTAQDSSEEWNESETDLGSEEPEAADDSSNEIEENRFERSPYYKGHNGQHQQQRVQIPHIDANPCAQTRPHLGYALPDVIFAHPNRCDKYINCVHGQPVIRECGPGTYFDPSAKNCGHWQTSYCLQTMKMPVPQASCTCNDYIIPPTHTVYIPPPNKHAPHHQPPVTRYIPPVTQPPTTRYVPPVTQPPTTRYVPPVTQPPTTRYVPPVTQPPTTRYVPPVTQPPTTRYVPPVTQPPTTRYVPPVTQPPKMCQCPCPVEQKNNGYNW